jgi:hypothetical protein
MRGSLKIAIGTTVACGLSAVVLPAQAATAAPVGRSLVVMVPIARTAAEPNANIKLKSGAVTFHPDSLSTTWSGPTQKKTCTTARERITITNKLTKSERITYLGSVIGKLPPGQSGGICFWGTNSEQFVFGLKNSSAQLTVSVS